MNNSLAFIHVDPAFRHFGDRVDTHVSDEKGNPLCGTKGHFRVGQQVNWENLHYGGPYGCLCKKCRETAVLQLRPKARFWYLDPFSGHERSFGSLRNAVAAAKKEHGTSTIFQVGPGEVNRIVRFVSGLDPLP